MTMKIMLTIVLACAAAWCLGPQPADAAAVLSPVTVEGDLGCNADGGAGAACVDVYTVTCPQNTRRIQAAVEDVNCDDNFLLTLVGTSPARILGIGRTDATLASSCGASTGLASVFIDLPGLQAPMKAVLTIHALTGSTNRDYSLAVACYADSLSNPVPKNVILEQTTDQ